MNDERLAAAIRKNRTINRLSRLLRVSYEERVTRARKEYVAKMLPPVLLEIRQLERDIQLQARKLYDLEEKWRHLLDRADYIELNARLYVETDQQLRDKMDTQLRKVLKVFRVQSFWSARRELRKKYGFVEGLDTMNPEEEINL